MRDLEVQAGMRSALPGRLVPAAPARPQEVPMPPSRVPGRYLPPPLALALRQARETRGWTGYAGARRLDVARAHLWRLEHGPRIPSRSLADALIALYDLDPDTARQLRHVANPTAGRDSPYRRLRALLPLHGPQA